LNVLRGMTVTSPPGSRDAPRLQRTLTLDGDPRPADDALQHPVDEEHEPHLRAALAWIARAQDVTACGGIARGYSHRRLRDFGGPGWQNDYPETTGYIIPTLLAAADRLASEEYAARAELAALWECGIQLESGAVRGGTIGAVPSPSIFNTGQVLLGWSAALDATGDPRYAAASVAAARFLVAALDADGVWRRGHSKFAIAGSALYNARTAWGLLAADARLGIPGARDAGALALTSIVRRQHDGGWFPECCLTQPDAPLVHTIAYTIRGLLEGGRLLDNPQCIAAAARAASALAEQVDGAGRLAGRFNAQWQRQVGWSCLTGEAQMVTNWIRLHEVTGESAWLAPVEAVLRHLKRTQDRESATPGIAGGINGAEPVDGDYGSHQTLSWATKFFADSLMRHERIRSDRPLPANHPLLLA
jgi:hypothetical protein